jgi:hypothetical protein
MNAVDRIALFRDRVTACEDNSKNPRLHAVEMMSFLPHFSEFTIVHILLENECIEKPHHYLLSEQSIRAYKT